MSGKFPIGDTWLPEYRRSRKFIARLPDKFSGYGIYTLTDPPSYDIWRIHPSFVDTYGMADVGKYGLINSRVEFNELLLDFRLKK